MKPELREVDRKIWSEIGQIIPENIFDFHIHCIYEGGFTGRIPDPLKIYLPCDIEAVLDNMRTVLPERKTTGIITGWPAITADLLKQNDYISSSAARNNLFFLALTAPQMDARYLENIAKKRECVGFKPYKCFADFPEDARITDYITEKQIEIADHYGLIITIHLSKRAGISDPLNLEDLDRLSEKYRSVFWNLAHCGRSFIPDYIENAAVHLKRLMKRNIYLDTAAVTDNEVFTIVFSEFGPDRILYGSDIPVSFLRGRCVGFGYDWAFITEETHSITASFPVKPALLLYEQIKAMNKAFRKTGFKMPEIEKIFFRNSEKIIQKITKGKEHD